MDYYVWMNNGAAAYNDHGKTNEYYHGGCPAGNTDEYCTGYKAGWNAEANFSAD
jgi:hypothetical protein